jgi:hypothetical protein
MVDLKGLLLKGTIYQIPVLPYQPVECFGLPFMQSHQSNVLAVTELSGDPLRRSNERISSSPRFRSLASSNWSIKRLRSTAYRIARDNRAVVNSPFIR